MPLPAPRTSWPPAEHASRYQRMRVHGAWYSGSPQRLAAVYGGATPSRNTDVGGPVRAVSGGLSSSVWGASPAEGDPDTRRHMPTAGDICTLSSELLHADAPRFIVEGPTETVPALDENDQPILDSNGRPQTVTRPRLDVQQAQERLDYLLRAANFPAVLLAAAETASAFGSVGLRVAFDKTAIPDRPTIVRVDAPAVLPDYVWGVLRSTTFWRVVARDTSNTWRHLELHEAGRVWNALYKGTDDNLGDRVPLTDHPATATIPADEDGALPVRFEILGVPVATAVSIPNMLPDPEDLGNEAGRSDYKPATLDALDAADRWWTQLGEDVDDAKSRLIVSRSMLESKGKGQGLEFSRTQRIFTKVNTPPAEKEGGGLPIEQVQFEMRAEEYIRLIMFAVETAIKSAGYNPQTMGTDGDVVQTATEYAGKHKRSMSTRDKKIRYWQDELGRLLTGLLVVDAQEFASGITPYPVRVEYPEAVQPTMRELAEVAKLLRETEAASRYTVVEALHPDWDASQIQAEVNRKMTESQTVDPITIGLGGV